MQGLDTNHASASSPDNPDQMDNADANAPTLATLRRRGDRRSVSLAQFNATPQFSGVLLVCVPVGFALPGTPTPMDMSSLLSISLPSSPSSPYCPPATEELALCTGEIFGGLLNASFGNATELRKGQGMCLFCGGINHVVQHFNITVHPNGLKH